MDRELVQKKLRGCAKLNEWELQEGRERLPSLTVDQGVQQYLSLWRRVHQLAPDAERVFGEQSIAHCVEVRARFSRVAGKTREGATS